MRVGNQLSPSIHKLDNEPIYSGLCAALGHEPFGLELMAERLGPNGVSNASVTSAQTASLHLRVETLSRRARVLVRILRDVRKLNRSFA